MTPAPDPSQAIQVAPTTQAVGPQELPVPAWERFAQSLPHDLPDVAYDAMRERFFHDRVAPDVLAHGVALEPARKDFMEKTGRHDIAFPRLALIAGSAGEAFGAPLDEGGITRESARLKARGEEAAAHQGIHTGAYEFLGQNIGMLPYYGPTLAASEAFGGVLGAAKGVQALINSGAGALVQGAYDAASAPTGGRMLAGAKGALAGAATVGGFELLHNSGSLMKVIKGVASEGEATEAAEQILSDPDLEKKITAEVGQQEAAAKQSGMPRAANVGRSNGTANATVKTADGKLYGVADPVARVPDIAAHLQQGASIEQVGGDPTTVEQVLRSVEKEQAKTGAFDTAAGPSDVAGLQEVEPDIPFDEIQKFVAGQSYVTPDIIQKTFKLKYSYTMDALNQMVNDGNLSMGEGNKFYWMGPENEEAADFEARMARSVRPTDLRQPEPEWDWQDHPASTNITRSAYDEDTQRLRIEFRSGHQYDYSPIPPGLRQEMLAADSVGKFFAQRIKPLDRTFAARQVAAPSGVPEVPTTEADDLAQRLQDSIDEYKARYAAKVRGSTPKGLDAEGVSEADILGARVNDKGGFAEIHGASLPRHQQTIDRIEAHNPMMVRYPPNPRLDPRGWGELESLPQEYMQPAMDIYMRDDPDATPPGISPYSGKPAESTTRAARRVLPEMHELAQRAVNEGKPIAAVVSSSDIAIAAGRAKAIRESNPNGLDFSELADMHESPGDVYSWDGAGDFQRVDMNSDDAFDNKLHLIRHGHTDWNSPVEDTFDNDFERMLDEAQEYGAQHKETPLVHRHVGDIPFLAEAGAEGATITPRPGEKPSIFYPTGVGRSTIFEENFHAGIGYMGLGEKLDDILHSEEHGPMTRELWENDVSGYYPGLRSDLQGEETFIKAAKAVRTGDAEELESLALADTDIPSLLEWTNNVTQELLDRVAEQPDSLHKRAMERRMNSVVTRATRSLDEMDRPYAGGAAGLDYENGRWAVKTAGTTRYFDTREDALEHLENNYAEPLNAPELVDYSKLPDNVARFARNERPPNIRRPPITSDPPPPAKEQPGGLFLFSRYFRPFYDWVADASKRLGRPELYDVFSRIDDGVVAMNNFQRPYTKALEETLRKIPKKDQSRFFKLAQALPADRLQTAKDLAFTPEEMDVFREFNERFGDPLEAELGVPLDTFIRQIMPRWQRGGVDTQYPHFPDVGKQKVFGDYNDALKTGEVSPHDQNLLRVAINYMRIGARRKFLGDTLNEAAEMVDEKNPDGGYRLGLLRTSLARHIEYMRGIPDHSAMVMESVASDIIERMNKGIVAVNEHLPSSLQVPTMDTPPREAYNKLILYMYAGELAMRPALLIRDGVQFFLTTLPILGKHAWSGLSKAVEMGKSAWDEPERRGVLIEKKDLQNLYSSGGDEEDSGMLERFAEKAMSWIQFSHNSNRMVAFWGHAAKAEEALHDFYAGKLDTRGLADESGMWFMKQPMRDKYVKEAQILDGRLPDFDAHVADLSRRIAKDMVELTQWNFKRGANPGIYEYQLGRLLGQYGTWPLNYIEYARRYFTSGSSPEAIKAGVRLALIHGAAQAAGAAAGVDISNWLWTSPMAYGGGPALEALTNVPQSMDFETNRGAEARHELRRAFFPGLIPGGEAASTIWEAATSNDPDFWVKTMGFSPIDKRAELRK